VDVRAAGHLSEGGARETVLGEQLLGGAEDPVLGGELGTCHRRAAACLNQTLVWILGAGQTRGQPRKVHGTACRRGIRSARITPALSAKPALRRGFFHVTVGACLEGPAPLPEILP